MDQGSHPNVKQEFNNTNSDSDAMDEDDDSRDASLAIEDNIKEEITIEELEMHSLTMTTGRLEDISLPDPANKPPEKKKEMKSKKEQEEEEREKMQ